LQKFNLRPRPKLPQSGPLFRFLIGAIMVAGRRHLAAVRALAPEVGCLRRYVFILKPVLCRAGMAGTRRMLRARQQEAL
jgi:hypothetical protein